MEFNIGDRVITEYGKGTIVKIYLNVPNTWLEDTYLVVHDKPHSNLHNDGSNNLPSRSCWWFPATRLIKEVQDEI